MKILNFGSLNIDYVYSVDHFVQKGETISSSQMNIFSGGKGLNQHEDAPGRRFSMQEGSEKGENFL